MAHINHHLKRLQTSAHSSDHHRSSIPDDEAMRESIQNLAMTQNNTAQHFRPFKPAPHRARRGGANGKGHDRIFYSTVLLPKRAINYDLAESFMDHSTNPLSSDLYKIRFKHSAKQWPNGRFINYKEHLDKSDGNIVDVPCTRTFPLVPKRKKIQQIQQTPSSTLSSSVIVDTITQEQKKKLADKQTNLYANLFGCGKNARLPSNTQIKKTTDISFGTKSSTNIALLGENKEDNPCS